MPYEQFLARKADFERAGCREDRNFSYSRCTRQKAPMNGFDWTDDGCSGAEFAWGAGRPVSLIYRNLFNGPCQQHDFGYRNFGKPEGLKLSRNEGTRKQIDDLFQGEMFRLCDSRFPRPRAEKDWNNCINTASAMYYVVRIANNWR